MARKKSPALVAPTTIAEATAALSDYVDILTTIEEARAAADASIANIEAARDQLVKPLEARLKELFIPLRAWWAVAGEAITDGKRKSAEIAGCLIGIRTSTPALKLPKGKTSADIVAALMAELGEDPFITTKRSINKPPIITIIRNGLPADPESPNGLLVNAIYHTLTETIGLSVTQTEEFFIDRARTEPAPADPLVLAPEGEH